MCVTPVANYESLKCEELLYIIGLPGIDTGLLTTMVELEQGRLPRTQNINK